MGRLTKRKIFVVYIIFRFSEKTNDSKMIKKISFSVVKLIEKRQLNFFLYFSVLNVPNGKMRDVRSFKKFGGSTTHVRDST